MIESKLKYPFFSASDACCDVIETEFFFATSGHSVVS